MISRPDNFTIDDVTRKLDTDIIGRNLYHFKRIDSTNLYAKKLVENGIREGAVVVSDVQSSGRGRKNRNWFSPYGGLWFSVVLYPHIPPERGMLLTMVSSVSVVQGFKELVDLCPVIKWPNDILIEDRKICGILTELDAEMDLINHAIVGIGINVNNQLDADLQGQATSLIQEIGSRISRVKLLRSIIRYFDQNYCKLISGDYRFIRDLWLSHVNIIGRNILVHSFAGSFSRLSPISATCEMGSYICDTPG